MQPEEQQEQPQSSYLNSAYGRHVLGMAEIAYAICDKYDLRDDSARQACFATVLIDAKEQLIFMSDLKKDQEAAKKADAQVKDIDPEPTPEKEEGVRRTELLKAINDTREMLNAEGLIPTMTPAGLNAFIKNELKLEGALGTIDGDGLELVIKALSEKLDALRAEKKKDTGVGF